MTDKPMERVKKFHKTFGAYRKDKPHIPPREIWEFRVAFIQEELDELKEGFENKDIIEIADALGDLSVVIDGTYDACCLSDYKDAISEEIFQSNMSKADENGNPILREGDGKILKGPNYFKPDLHKVLGINEEEQKRA